MEIESRITSRRGIPYLTEIGAAFSVLYVGLLVWLVARRWEDVTKLPLNELGDFAAGAFGPMAILWLVLGYFQQGEELKQNTEALRQQAEELANTVRQQEKLVELGQQQLEREKQLVIAESERRIAASRPKFDYSIAKNPVDISGKGLKISIRNDGAPCSHIRVVSAVQSVTPIVEPAGVEQQTRTVVLMVMDDDPLEALDLAISYLDSTGNPGTQKFWLSLHKDERSWGYTVAGEDDQKVWNHARSGI